jgi:acetyl esterase/lipase
LAYGQATPGPLGIKSHPRVTDDNKSGERAQVTDDPGQGPDARVLSVDYWLAPEDPFPAAVDDALAAFDDTVARTREFGVDPDRIVVGGDSPGATLAAVTARRTADRADGPVPAGQWLLYPATDLAARHPSRDRLGHGFLLTDEDIVWFQDHYVPSGIDRTDPLVSVLYGTVAPATPPAHLVTAGFDPLRDEGERYAESCGPQACRSRRCVKPTCRTVSCRSCIWVPASAKP